MCLLKSICQKWILEQVQHQERTDDSIAKVWSKTGSLSYHYTDLWAEVKLPRNIQINLGLETLHRLLHNATYYSLERVISEETEDKGRKKGDGHPSLQSESKVVQEPEKTIPVSITLRGFCKSCFSRDPEHTVSEMPRFSSLMADRSFSCVFPSKEHALIAVD